MKISIGSRCVPACIGDVRRKLTRHCLDRIANFVAWRGG
jgi:hypothetical protein